MIFGAQLAALLVVASSRQIVFFLDLFQFQLRCFSGGEQISLKAYTNWSWVWLPFWLAILNKEKKRKRKKKEKKKNKFACISSDHSIDVVMK